MPRKEINQQAVTKCMILECSLARVSNPSVGLALMLVFTRYQVFVITFLALSITVRFGFSIQYNLLFHLDGRLWFIWPYLARSLRYYTFCTSGCQVTPRRTTMLRIVRFSTLNTSLRQFGSHPTSTHFTTCSEVPNCPEIFYSPGESASEPCCFLYDGVTSVF